MRCEYCVVYDGTEGLVIRDLNSSVSITNAAEAVVASLAGVLDGRGLFYFDSDDRLGEIVVRASRFAGFSPGASGAVADALRTRGLL